ncbi:MULTISPECIES: cytidine deaminase family protein [Leuconostoc]|uniref:cytidine deaminase family protein n=1 Tax=Leuconostoc TaxID=1243 RepID=UPI000246662B|nr:MULTISPECIES: cytidine deaminase [Leuconostoc]MBZ1507582.1 cytidine deaminase [Leuconostoc mesenteroides]MBZ1516286.1 cytidine deaminase [Leuconostoc mesenteroides]MBZ1518585.1 cytidine deaminase [Leuconostoc mesenteroides]MBZ1521331.1 cytidine deaminase [Leuconostoc mesenteroides]CCF27593.1 Cytidine/deoxycytidylate deaminase family protein [Leuconostoc citreum LBAE C11]
MSTSEQWTELYEKSKNLIPESELSEFFYAGSVGAAILSDTNKIYTGVSIDTACSIGFCAERNAIGTMVSNGDKMITKMVATKNDEIIMPCGVCREFMMQLGPQSKDVEVLVSLNPLKTIKLSNLIPNYWA